MGHTILFDDQRYETDGASETVDALWLPDAELEAATGFHREERGLCRGDTCLPVPPSATWAQPDRIDLLGFAAHRGQGVARDRSACVVSFGPPTGVRFADGVAPDFELPDFAGKTHRLSQYRGQKVLLMTWASW